MILLIHNNYLCDRNNKTDLQLRHHPDQRSSRTGHDRRIHSQGPFRRPHPSPHPSPHPLQVQRLLQLQSRGQHLHQPQIQCRHINQSRHGLLKTHGMNGQKAKNSRDGDQHHLGRTLEKPRPLTRHRPSQPRPASSLLAEAKPHRGRPLLYRLRVRKSLLDKLPHVPLHHSLRHLPILNASESEKDPPVVFENSC
jgi:hypothetical protein